MKLMRWWLVLSCCLFVACGTNSVDAENNTIDSSHKQNTTMTAETTVIEVQDTSSHASFSPAQIKKPSGIYQFVLPYEANQQIVHTVAFYPGSFRLQEEYLHKPDSVTTTTGTWAPSQGQIWLYKDHLVRGRYSWKGDTLQYYSPRLKKNFSLARLTSVIQNPAWQDRRKAGDVLFGTGTEPFWSVQITGQDSLVLSMPDWPAPLRTKITSKTKEGSRRVYTAESDSLTVTVLPYFCNDGMSDFIYTRKMAITYRGKSYTGCGELF